MSSRSSCLSLAIFLTAYLFSITSNCIYAIHSRDGLCTFATIRNELPTRRKMLPWAARPPRSWFRACVFMILLCFIVYCLSIQRHTRRRASFSANQSANSHHAADLDDSTTSDSCPASTSAQRIVVSVKTGATEAAVKIPMQMQTTLRCVKNVFLFSDLEQDIGEYHLHDAL